MAQALWHINASHSQIRECEPDQVRGYVKIKSLCSLISIGTERTVCSGHSDHTFEKHMKVPFMEGSFDLPIKYGYSVIGHKLGNPRQLFHFMHPHQSICWVKPEDLTHIPSGIPAPRASLISNMETVINACWDANLQIGDRVLVLGFGTIGSLLSLYLKQQNGMEVQVLDIDTWRMNKAVDLGLSPWKGEQDFDSVFHTTGTGQGLQKSIELTRKDGQVIELSWYGNKKISLELGADFHYGRKSIISSQVSSIPPAKAQQWDFKKRKKLAIEILKDAKFDELITHQISLYQSPEFFCKLRAGEHGKGLNWIITYP